MSRLQKIRGDASVEVRRRRAGYRFSATAWAEGAAGLKLDPWQKRVLMSQASRIAILAVRQAGKSTITAILAGWTAVLDRPGSTSVLVAPGERQARLLLSRVKDFLRTIPPEYSSNIAQESESRLVFENGSQIVALPSANPDTLRGYSIGGILAVDEASWALESEGDAEGGGSALLAAVMPALMVAGGRAVFISSAGLEGCLFYKINVDGWGDFQTHEVNVEDVPRLTPEVIRQLEHTLSPTQFAREVENQWTSGDVGAMDVAAFRAAATPGPVVDLGPLMLV